MIGKRMLRSRAYKLVCNGKQLKVRWGNVKNKQKLENLNILQERENNLFVKFG